MDKKIFTLLGLACLFSCEMDPLNNEGCFSNAETASVRFSLSESFMKTKKVTIDETAINNCQLIIFSKNDGKRIAYSRNIKDGMVDMEVPKGQSLKCYALVNVPENMSTVSSETELLGKRAYFKDNSVSSFEMIGKFEGNISTDTLICIPVERFVAKIQIDGVLYNLKCGYTEVETSSGCDPKFNEAYILNSADDCGYDFKKEPSHYTQTYYESLNKKQYDMTNRSASSSLTHQIVTRDNQRWRYCSDILSVYCFPNHSEPYTNMNRSQIVLSFGGQYRDVSTNVVRTHRHYFTFTLPVLEHNTLYDLGEIRIKAEGTSSPSVGNHDHPLSVNLSCDIDVVDMTSGKIKQTIPLRKKLYEIEEN